MRLRRLPLTVAPGPGGMRAAALTAAAVAVVTAAGVSAAVSGVAVLATVVILGQGLLAWSWTSQQRASAGATMIVVAAAVACDATLLARDSTEIGDLAGVVGAAVPVVVLYQLARRRAPAGVGGARPPVPAGTGDPDRSEEPATAQGDRSNGQSPGFPPARSGRSAGRSARVTVDIAAALSGVGFVALFAAVLALHAENGQAGGDGGQVLAAAGLLGVGVGVGTARLVAGVARGGAMPEAAVLVARAGVGVAVAAAAGAVVGAVADVAGVTAVELIAVAVAVAAAALAVDTGLARGEVAAARKLAREDRAAPGQAPASAGGVATDARASLAVAALLPFAVAAPVAYLLGQLALR